MSASICSLGRTPASVSALALIMTMNRIIGSPRWSELEPLFSALQVRRTENAEIDMVRRSIGQEWHRQALVAAEQHRSRDRGCTESLADAVDDGIDRTRRVPTEGQRQLDSAVVFEIGERHADERQPLAGDRRLDSRVQPSGRGENDIRFARRLSQRV